MDPSSSDSPEPPRRAALGAFREQMRPAVLGVLLLTLLTGCIFPLLFFAVARPFFPRQASGSLWIYNLTTIAAMLAGRFGAAALALALAGRFAAQRRLPMTAGTLPADTPACGALVFGTILLVGALCFFPALALGPIVEFLRR